jgi:hypothetical protein
VETCSFKPGDVIRLLHWPTDIPELKALEGRLAQVIKSERDGQYLVNGLGMGNWIVYENEVEPAAQEDYEAQQMLDELGR